MGDPWGAWQDFCFMFRCTLPCQPLAGAGALTEEMAMLKLIRLQHPRYERFAVAALFVAQYAGIEVRRVLQSLRPKVRFGAD